MPSMYKWINDDDVVVISDKSVTAIVNSLNFEKEFNIACITDCLQETISIHFKRCQMYIKVMAVYNYWTGLDWWNKFFLSVSKDSGNRLWLFYIES